MNLLVWIAALFFAPLALIWGLTALGFDLALAGYLVAGTCVAGLLYSIRQ